MRMKAVQDAFLNKPYVIFDIFCLMLLGKPCSQPGKNSRAMLRFIFKKAMFFINLTILIPHQGVTTALTVSIRVPHWRKSAVFLTHPVIRAV